MSGTAPPRARGIVFPLVVAALALTLVGCAADGAAGKAPPSEPSVRLEYPVTLEDDEGVEVTLDAAPQRIVTFGPSHTEIVYALGLGERLVGVCCRFDDFPPAAKDLPHVEGAGLQPNIEKVVSLDPDVLLNAFPGAGPWATKLRDAGVPSFTTLATDFDDAVDDIETIARLLGATAEGTRIANAMAARAGDIEQKATSEPAVSCFLDLGGLYTVGPNDFLYDMLERAGCDPVTSNAKTSFPQWSVEQLVKDDPSVYLFTSDSGATVRSIEEQAGLAGVEAIEKGRVIEVNGDLVSRPGPRLTEGLLELAQALHPDAF